MFSWKAVEADLRGEWKRQQDGAGRQKALKLIETPPAKLAAAQKEKSTEARVTSKAHPDGPKLVTRGMGEWLRKVVTEQLDATLPEELFRRLEQRIDSHVDERVRGLVSELVEAELERMFARRKPGG